MFSFSVEILLNKTELNIAVYNGNLDIITPLAGNFFYVHIVFKQVDPLSPN